MKNTNYEIKAQISEEKQRDIRNYLIEFATEFRGIDYQTDTYFKVPEGRLKIRRGNIENKLIYYEREDKLDSKESDVLLVDLHFSENLEDITRKTHDILVEIKKKREIYFIDNVKFLLDDVENLGTFMEIEAISENNFLPLGKIKGQCDYYKDLFKIKESDLIKNSYSDMLLEQISKRGDK